MEEKSSDILKFYEFFFNDFFQFLGVIFKKKLLELRQHVCLFWLAQTRQLI